MSVDTIGDFLTVIRNAIRLFKPEVTTPYSSLKEQVTRVLQEEGFIRGYEVVETNVSHKNIKVFLKYVGDGSLKESVIHEITRISKPGCRVYKSSNLKPVKSNLGISILSTSGGILTDKQAKQKNVGGEVLCTVW